MEIPISYSLHANNLLKAIHIRLLIIKMSIFILFIVCLFIYFLLEEFRNGGVDDACPAGVDSTLSFENPDNMISLPIIKYDQKQVTQYMLM
jgi:hypothetical protein